MRWPRKNDEASIEARRAVMGVDGGLTTSVDLAPFGAAAESLVGVAVIPVSAAPVEIELGSVRAVGDAGSGRGDGQGDRERCTSRSRTRKAG